MFIVEMLFWSALCALRPDPGRCSVTTTKWYYHYEYGICLQFTFGGCEGNANKFDSKEECEGVCAVEGEQF